jgi:hypothetical protein
MSATDVKLAQAVTDALNAPPPFSLPFTAVRAYASQRDLIDLETLRVTVVPAIMTFERGSRWAANQHDYEIQVELMQKVNGQASNVELDPLRQLVEEVAIRLLALEVADPPCRCRSVVHDPLWAQEPLRTRGEFLSRLVLSFRLFQ